MDCSPSPTGVSALTALLGLLPFLEETLPLPFPFLLLRLSPPGAQKVGGAAVVPLLTCHGAACPRPAQPPRGEQLSLLAWAAVPEVP